jgi:hypothetical protein
MLPKIGILKSDINFLITYTGINREKKSRIPVENQKLGIRLRLMDGG